jgi:hypothetical protein
MEDKCSMEDKIVEEYIEDMYEAIKRLEESRSRSMMLTKLDELRLWLIEYRYLEDKDKKGLE